MIKLKPCPFCGDKLEPISIDPYTYWHRSMHDDNNKCPIKYYKIYPDYTDYDFTYKSWNKRANNGTYKTGKKSNKRTRV